MENQPEDQGRVQITKAIFDGLEFIRRSGVTNMLDRPTVLTLAKAWGFPETVDWIESVDTSTYGRLIFQGPEVVGDDRASQTFEQHIDSQEIERTPSDHGDEDEAIDETNDIDLTEMAMDHVRETMQDLLATLGNRAILTIVDTYVTQRMGVLVNPSRNNLITAERDALIRNLGHASSLWLQLDAAMAEVERGIGSLRYLIDPESDSSYAGDVP